MVVGEWFEPVAMVIRSAQKSATVTVNGEAWWRSRTSCDSDMGPGVLKGLV